MIYLSATPTGQEVMFQILTSKEETELDPAQIGLIFSPLT